MIVVLPGTCLTTRLIPTHLHIPTTPYVDIPTPCHPTYAHYVVHTGPYHTHSPLLLTFVHLCCSLLPHLTVKAIRLITFLLLLLILLFVDSICCSHCYGGVVLVPHILIRLHIDGRLLFVLLSVILFAVTRFVGNDIYVFVVAGLPIHLPAYCSCCLPRVLIPTLLFTVRYPRSSFSRFTHVHHFTFTIVTLFDLPRTFVIYVYALFTRVTLPHRTAPTLPHIRMLTRIPHFVTTVVVAPLPLDTCSRI